MRSPLVFLYPGHGGQTYQMARSLYEHAPGFRSWMRALDDLFHEALGFSVLEALYDDSRSPTAPLHDISVSHPAIFMTEVALSRQLIEQRRVPDFAVGASLGEFAAMTVAGGIDLDAAVSAVARQALALASAPSSGGMMAVLANLESVGEPIRHSGCEVAAEVGRDHLVVAGTEPALLTLEASLVSLEVTSLRLPVTHAFHSIALEPLRELVAPSDLALVTRTPQFPVISCTTCMASPCAPRSSDWIWQVVRNPLQIRAALDIVGRLDGAQFVDVGPGAAFANALRSNRRGRENMQIFRILSPFGDEVAMLSRAEERLAS